MVLTLGGAGHALRGQRGETEAEPQVLSTAEPRDPRTTVKPELGFLQSMTQVPG